MIKEATPQSPRITPLLPLSTALGVAAAMLAIVAIAFFTYRSMEVREEAVEGIRHTLDVRLGLDELVSTMKDAETGQRGYLLVGEESYLAPFTAAQVAIPGQISQLRALTVGMPSQTQRVDALEALVQTKLAELSETVTLRRRGDLAGAMAIVNTDRGKNVMDQIRSIADAMAREEDATRTARDQAWQQAVTVSTTITAGGSVLLLVLIAGAAYTMSRNYRAGEAQNWVRAGQVALAERVSGDLPVDTLGQRMLGLLAERLEAHAGALYVAEGSDLRRIAGYALSDHAVGEVVRIGEGLVGQAAQERRTLRVRDVPAGYMPVASGLGRGAPAELLIAPVAVDGVLQGVIELGFFRAVIPAEEELLSRAADALGVAVRASRDRSRLEELLAETQQQAEELQAQQEELRVSNEELEEQGRVLRESQARLENQQTELEQINAQLEEQTHLLEEQKDDLAAAQAVLADKAAELERANQYKSEFLANMSHELRTPLNSSLILSKLLADNKDGNLTDEQVRYAQTILSAGNDLLVLINDVLDLAKIESGKVELARDKVAVAALVEGLARAFRPLAEQKGLAFDVEIDPGAPGFVETDEQRLNQILKNLLSNAVKFTEHGGVRLRAFSDAPDTVSFAVTDTGIGIPEAQRAIIFEAFRQADGSTHRKYGGTGLGLSISRDLARLLGGDIAVASTPGQGSAFTLRMPIAARAGDTPAPIPIPPAAPSFSGQPRRTPAPSLPALDDDRAQLPSPATRSVLIIEDDVAFAGILRDLARERGFLAIVAHSAGEGLAAARAHAPSAILLDVNLPDHSGLGVLDQLKRNPETRHVPVHVVSVTDYAQQALERGAIGYALKPVQREELIDAFRRFEERMRGGPRRVLIVEDDERQRESIRELLASETVQITGVGKAADALEALRHTTFDCVVMDLSLPDFSGYDLLERMATEERTSFPPVIVYTGRSLTRDEEQRLARYSKSIIIKDARSPERLLDEVTLFLHQVEATLPVERQRMLKAARARDAALEGRRVLVVEDDARNIFALSSVLEPKGIRVEIARNGREAVQAVTASRTEPIDLVLMDIMMPEMDGLTAMREIRRHPELRKLPIIALTAKAMKDDQEKCLAAGANDYIAKPLDVEKLLSLVRVWMPKP